jgi:uncharacterized membrane-anchored protein YhcB (DUF1043 family)
MEGVISVLNMYIFIMLVTGIVHLALTIRLINIQRNEINILENNIEEITRDYNEYRLTHSV